MYYLWLLSGVTNTLFCYWIYHRDIPNIWHWNSFCRFISHNRVPNAFIINHTLS